MCMLVCAIAIGSCLSTRPIVGFRQSSRFFILANKKGNEQKQEKDNVLVVQGTTNIGLSSKPDIQHCRCSSNSRDCSTTKLYTFPTFGIVRRRRNTETIDPTGVVRYVPYKFYEIATIPRKYSLLDDTHNRRLHL